MHKKAHREFLGKMAAFASATAEVRADAPTLSRAEGTDADEVAAEVRHAWCQMCGPARTHCSTLCHVRDGRWLRVEGNPKAGNNYGRGSRTLCAKGNAAMQVLYDPFRIAYPMRRAGEKGEGKFVRCTWDAAYRDIAAQLAALKKEFGPESYGVLSPQAYQVLWTLGRRFLNVHGSPNYLHSGICALQRKASKRVCLGAADCTPGQLDKTKLLVVWGSNPENSEVNRGKPMATLDAVEGGMKVIDIRPMMDPLAAKADIWVPIRPGTDGALALAILNRIIAWEMYDSEFVDAWCNGFDKLAEHVRPFTPAWAERITGVPMQQIEEVAAFMGTMHPMGIQYGNGIGDQQNDGNWTCIAICLIEAITGNLDIPGGGGAKKVLPPPLVKTKKIDVLTERLPESEEDRRCGYYAGMSKLAAPETPRWYQNPATWESGPNSAYFKALMGVLGDGPNRLHAVLGQASNPFGATRQPKRIAEALRHIDLYFVHDTHWNTSCDYADYVLPACTHYECSQQFGVKNSEEGTFIAINQKVAEPLGQARSDWDFYLGLAQAMGYGDDFWDGDMDACLREQLEGSGISLEELRAAEGGIFIERTDGACATEPPYRTYEKLFAELPNGKVQCYNEWIGGKPDADGTGTLGYLPEYAGPPESLAGTPELAEEYPLILSDVHAYRLCNHSYYAEAPYLRELQPYPWVKINPATAQRYGIADGDWMRVESPHGWIRLKAEYFEGISPEVLMCRRGWWRESSRLGLDGHGAFDGGSDSSVLYDTTETNFDPFHSAMAKQTLVRISKERDKMEPFAD